MPVHADEWSCIDGIPRLAKRIVPLSPVAARALFLRRFEEITGQSLGEHSLALTINQTKKRFSGIKRRKPRSFMTICAAPHTKKFL